MAFLPLQHLASPVPAAAAPHHHPPSKNLFSPFPQTSRTILTFPVGGANKQASKQNHPPSQILRESHQLSDREVWVLSLLAQGSSCRRPLRVPRAPASGARRVRPGRGALLGGARPPAWPPLGLWGIRVLLPWLSQQWPRLHYAGLPVALNLPPAPSPRPNAV